ncbi:MAG: hypothetical protein O2894_00835 [Planctomycetota bacterium]|nr:hypothetical protein [Planctomycetota bacterium]
MADVLPYEPVLASLDAPYELRGEPARTLEPWDRHVIVDVVHDGVRVPPELTPLLDEAGALRPDVRAAFIRERDWGAAAVAERLAFHLGLRGYQHVQAARVVSDYNRFRGWSVPESGHLGRRALFPPASELLSSEQGEHALARCFDPVSAAIHARCEEAFRGVGVRDARLTRVTVHTYDDRVGSGQRRPKASLIFTPFEYHEFARLPANIYPPVFPDRLAEFTADRALAYRIALMLEKNYLPVAINSPYFLPLGGAEMRLQVWCFLRHLQDLVRAQGGDAEIQQFEPLWPQLLDVRTPWVGRNLGSDVEARVQALEAWVEANRFEAVQRYRYSAYRPNAIEVEVRKDVIWAGGWEVLADGREAFVPEPGGLREDSVERIASIMASGIREYLVKDQPQKRAGARVQ